MAKNKAEQPTPSLTIPEATFNKALQDAYRSGVEEMRKEAILFLQSEQTECAAREAMNANCANCKYLNFLVEQLRII